MASAQGKPQAQGPSSSHEGPKHKSFDREIKDMISTITHRATEIHRSRSEEEEDDPGVRMITLAGTNTGATFRGEVEERHGLPSKGLSHGDPEGLSTYVNSNFQALNNSIMLGDSSYTTHDPGVHVEVSDFSEKPDNGGRKEKKKAKGHLKSEHSGHSD